ncbi:zinc-binding dehydrogenase [Cryptosporangium aurantiacum]|uniref:alcohol dehydrogenase n=1 Tax=Cryptosporangium aurantiacum TaxID=134849 RepID=A0A1M7RAS1_9ACTN|nr:zinc-binding dehydrogenase [Cryptosporangium aurantiacum]SHN43291.1 putative phosphonate catabolism associated alcohol dehydrogenase [Cryptosporangium aurantiacum]
MALARYARWDGPGLPFTIVRTPVPDLGRGEVLVEVDLATVCGSDLHTASGRRPGPAPGVLGHEQVGRVVAVGPGEPRCADGTTVTEGLRVVWSVTASCGECPRCRRGLPQKCVALRKYGHEPLTAARPLTGGFATHCVLLPGTTIVAVPAEVPDEVAAPASCATATVAATLAAAGWMLPWSAGNGRVAARTTTHEPDADRAPADGVGADGGRAVVSGAGMLGLTAVAMLARANAHVVAVDPDPGRRARAVEFGAHEVAADGADLRDADLVLELSGAPSAVQSALAALAIGGTAVLAGSVSPGPAVPFDPERLVRGLHRVIGVHNYRAADLRTAVGFLAATHRDAPFAKLVGGRYRLDDLDAAFAAAHRGPAPRQAVAPRD